MTRVLPGLSLGLLVAASATPAAADAPAARAAERPVLSPIAVDPAGGVTVDDVRYPDMEAFHRSQKFRDEGRRCGAVAPAYSAFAPSDCSLTFTSVLPDYEPGDAFEIPVVVHVIENAAGEGRISDDLLRSQIEILNEDFQALAGTPGEPGAFSAIRFVLARVDPDGNPTTGIERVVHDGFFRDSPLTRPSLAWNPEIYLNVYTNEASGALGYATFPQLSAGEPDDGVVLLWTSVGRDAPMGGVYNQGRTATHEVGHYFGLYHTFEDGCSGATSPYAAGDLIADTQPERDPTFGCPAQAPSGCGDGTAPIENYMDYSDDICMNRFTAEQVNRMRCTIVNYRAGLLNAWPEAGFTATTTDGLSFVFTDASTDANDAIARWEWEFGGGGRAAGARTSHVFAAFGVYDVALTVTDGFGARRRVVLPVVADPPPAVSFTHDVAGLVVQFSDRSVDPNGDVVSWAWDFGDGGTSTEADPVHTYAAFGTYTVTLTATDEAGMTGRVSAEIEVADTGGCGCVAGGSSGGGAQRGGALAAMLALALMALRRRRG